MIKQMWAFDAGGPPHMGRYAGGGRGALRFLMHAGRRHPSQCGGWRSTASVRPGRARGQASEPAGPDPQLFWCLAASFMFFVASRRGRPSWSPASNAGGMGDLPSNRSRRRILSRSANAASTVSMILTGSMNIHPSIGIQRNSSSSWCCRCWCGTRWGRRPPGSVALTRPPSCGGPCPGTHCWIRC